MATEDDHQADSHALSSLIAALERGAHAVLATLLHEAAHALGRVREINDTSRQQRYHNGRFKALAEELGLVAEQRRLSGWATTTLSPTTPERYAGAITAIEDALRIYRSHERFVAGRPRAPSSAPYVCTCGRRIRVAPSVYARGAIMCANCMQPFDPVG